jgi:uncharacterized protein YbaP (TraB family)
MRKFKGAFYAFIGLLSCLIPRLAAAQDDHKPAAPVLHCLWKAEGKSNVVYLLGTVHLLKADNYPLPAVIESAFTNSQIAAFEADIDKEDDPGEQAKMLEKISLPPGETIAQELSPAVYASFSNHVKEVGIPLEALQQFKPAMAVMTLEMMELSGLGVDPEYGVDKHFFKLARNGQKRIVPFETVDFQIGLLTGLSKAEEQLMVEKSLEEIDDEKKLYGDVMTAWQKGDAAGLETMLNKMRTEAPSVFKKLVTDRTASWMPLVDQMLHGSQNAIVIVGAGHLVGADGMVELLRKKGVKLTQL